MTFVQRILAVMGLLFWCSNCTEARDATYSVAKIKGGAVLMEKHLIGRFSLSLPVGMILDAQTARLREADIVEFKWSKASNHEEQRINAWNAKLFEINSLLKPEKAKKVVVEERNLFAGSQWVKGIFYYGNHSQDDEGFWDILVDAGETGAWFKYNGQFEAKEEMLQWVLAVARAYQPLGSSAPSGNSFCLKHGMIKAPYKFQESSYSRFVGHPLNLTLKVEMTETHTDEPEDEGVLSRVAAAILTGYAAGVDIDRIRSRKRKVAGLDGEEEVDRMASKDETELSFVWRYAGKKDSGEYPEIVLDMESPDGNLDEKLKVWDAILDSMKPLYGTHPN